MVELLISMAIGLLVVGGGIFVFTQNEKVLREQSAQTTVMGGARIGMNVISRELQGAGFGLPPQLGIQNIGSATQITFWKNIGNWNAPTGQPDSSTARLTANIAIGASQLTVDSTTGFAGGDKIVVYNIVDPATPAPETLAISSIAGNVISVTPNFLAAWDSTDPIMVSEYNAVVISYNAGTQQVTKTVDGGTTIPMVSNVSSLNLVYRDNADAITTVAANVRKIEITLTLTDPDPAHAGAEVTLNTFVNVRNMGA
ncbi:MAG: PilW family protein [Nitrospinaceae bacterium]